MLRGDIACRQYVDIKKNNLNNLYNNKQRFARISPLRGPCKPRVAARETTMNNASPWKRFLLIVHDDVRTSEENNQYNIYLFA